MMQAWIVLPALAAGYLAPLAKNRSPLLVKRRLRDTGIAGAACVAVSLSWIALYTLTPAHDRPYIDGSTNNSAISMVFGYNGLERFGISFPGSVASMFGGNRGGAVTGPLADIMRDMQHSGFGMRSGGGWLKLGGSEFGPQISWLFPLALLAMVCGLLWSRRDRDSSGSRAGGYVMWGVWLVTFGFVFSAMKVIPHTAYVASLAPALAALSGAGIVMFWREYAAGTSRGWLLAEMGRKDEALATLDRALTLEPNFATAWYYRASLTSYAPGDRDLVVMERMADNPDAPYRTKLCLSFALGKAYLDMGDGERAFARLGEGNRLQRALLDYEPDADARRFAEIDKAFGQWEMSGIATIQYAVDNEIHHRGQGYVYLRALGIEPPHFWER